MYRLSRLLFILALLSCLYSLAIIAAMWWPRSGFLLAVAAIALAGRRGHARLTTLGSARWANQTDLRRAGMVGAPSGLMIGHLLLDNRGCKAAAIMGLLRWRLTAEEACRQFRESLKNRGPMVRLPNAIHTAVYLNQFVHRWRRTGPGQLGSEADPFDASPQCNEFRFVDQKASHFRPKHIVADRHGIFDRLVFRLNLHVQPRAASLSNGLHCLIKAVLWWKLEFYFIAPAKCRNGCLKSRNGQKLVRLEKHLAGLRNAPTPVRLLGQSDNLCSVACAIFSLGATSL
jgi:hypothetical protein